VRRIVNSTYVSLDGVIENDELRLWVHPFLVGHATPNDLLFRRSSGAMFELADTVPLTSGIVVLTYRA
jgi:hypothetical protein